MSNSILLGKSKAFALEVIRLCNDVKTNKKESVGLHTKVALTYLYYYAIIRTRL